jgi:putative membrane protein
MLWIKAFHIIFMVCWFAGVFYLPRLFVYHAMSNELAVRQQLSIMEGKLYRFVSIFAILTTVLGLSLVALNPGYYFAAPWFHAKLLLVVCLIVYHLYCGVLVKTMASGENQRSHVFFRWFNELPVIFLFGIVILVVIKPF